MKLIVFSGLDGAGKSTQIELIKSSFLKQNKKCFIFWSRGGYTPGFQKLKNIIRKILKNKLPKPGRSQQRDASFGNPLIKKIWLIISIVDLIFYYSIFLRIKLLLGHNIICDRFILDTKIDFNIAYPNEKIEDWLLWKVLLCCSIKPNYHFLLLISVKESMDRSLLKAEPFPDSFETLEKRLAYYETYSNNAKNIHTLWCNKPIDEVSKLILKKLQMIK